MSDKDCPLCGKLGQLDQLGEEVVWRFPHSIAFLGPWQFYHGYCVLVSRQHARELSHLEDHVRRAYLEEMCQLARAIELACGPHKLNYELLGNQVPHLHWHLFPRYREDAAHLSPVWLALDAAERDEAMKAKLRTGPVPRTQVVALLRQRLISLGASSA